ncbi:EexN family lipoprotein, partial [Gilliamella apicola]
MKKILILVVLFLTGCDNNKTVSYWSEHPEERTDYLKKCRNGDVDR